MTEKKKSKPGSVLIGIGLTIAAVVTLLLIAVVSTGGDARTWPGIVVGLVIAGIGFAMRVLNALENKPTSIE